MSESQADDILSLATAWRAEAEHGGSYQALATGEYARRGLDVQIIQGGPGVNVPQLLASGSTEFGIGSNAFIVLNLAAEKVPVKAVMAVPGDAAARATRAMRSVTDWDVFGFAISRFTHCPPLTRACHAASAKARQIRGCADHVGGADRPSHHRIAGRGVA